MKKYLLLGGIIDSKNGIVIENFYCNKFPKYYCDEHYISAKKLQELYNLPINECILANKESDLNGINYNNLIILQPRFLGDYKEYLQEILYKENFNAQFRN